MRRAWPAVAALSLTASLTASLAVAPTPARSEPCEIGAQVAVAGQIAELSSNLLNVYAAMRVAEPACAFDLLEMTFPQAEGCAEGDLLVGAGAVVLSDIGRRALAGEDRRHIRMSDVACRPPG